MFSPKINNNSGNSAPQSNIHNVQPKETLYSIAKKYEVSIETLRKYNGINDDNTIKAGQNLKIPPKTAAHTNTSIMPAAKSKSSNEKEFTMLPKEDIAPLSTVSAKSFKEIAAELKSLSKHIAAVGDDDFAQTLHLINRNNVINVVKEYNRISPKESLIDMICSEIGSSQKSRKDAVNHVMNALCQKVSTLITTSDAKINFQKELDAQFDALGFVSTEKMDKIMNTLIRNYEIMAVRKTQEAIDKRVVKLKKTKTTSGALQRDAQKTAKTQNTTGRRPDPVLDTDGNIIANVKVIKPLKRGSLDGKTIVINAGHGGYNPYSGVFDIGSSIKDTNGKTVEEWQINDKIVKKLIPLLTMNGAKVVYMNGSAINIKHEKSKHNADLFISIHCDMASEYPGRSGQSIIFRAGNNNKKLAEFIEKNLEKDKTSIDDKTCVAKEDTRDLGILKYGTSIPSVVVETGFLSNKSDLKKLQDATFQAKFAQNIATGINEYFKSQPAKSSQQDKASKTHLLQPALVHKIQKGETLSILERKYGLRAGELAFVNKLDPAQGIKVGQKLRIPERYNLGNLQNKNDVAKILGFKSEFIQDLINYEGKKGIDIHRLYDDTVGNPTIGYGHLVITNFDKKYYKDRMLSNMEIYTLLAKDLLRAENAIRTSIGSENYERLSQKQKQAVVDFVFSRGSGTFNSDACKELRNGLIEGDYDKAAANLTYNRSIKTGEVRNGLTKRRLYEMAMFAGDKKSKTVLNAARKLFKEGLLAGKNENLNKGTLDAYIKDVNKWFDGKL